MDYSFDDPVDEPVSAFDRVHFLQNGLISFCTGGTFDGGDRFYKKLRAEFMAQEDTKELLPSFILRCRDTGQFWQFIKPKIGTYAERRTYLYEEFSDLLSHLEFQDRAPHETTSAELFDTFTPGLVSEIWHKAMVRKATDPAGAITLSRTLLESVCKYILDDKSLSYPQNADLPKLWKLCAEELNLSPDQHNEQAFKAILGNCQSIVNYLGALRNKLSDSHGQGKLPAKPKPRHAELVVNLAGAMATFLVSTWQEK